MSTVEQQAPGIRSGEEEGLYEACIAPAFHAALAVLRSQDDAEEIAQDACLVALEKVKAGKRIGSPAGYAAKVAYTLALKELHARAGSPSWTRRDCAWRITASERSGRPSWRGNQWTD